MFRTICAFLLCIYCLSWGQVVVGEEPAYKPPLERFKAIKWKSGRSPEVLNGYRLYIPPNVADKTSWPLIVWLHGEGFTGQKTVNLHWVHLFFEASKDSPPVFILAPQRKEDMPWFVSQGSESADGLGDVHQIIDQVISEYPIDPDRVYLCGVSSGATACWELACRHSERFAAMVPMSSFGGDVARAKLLVKIPIWVFHCKVDLRSDPQGDRDMVAAVKAAGGMIELTETDAKASGKFSTHDAWTAAFRDYKFLDWMLEQRRGKQSAPPGPTMQKVVNTKIVESFAWFKDYAWIGLPWLGLIILVRIIWISERKRRSAANTNQSGRN